MSFTPAATLGAGVTYARPHARGHRRARARPTRGAATTTPTPTLSAALGLPGLVAQGVQVAGPAYGVLLDAWGEDFLAHGEIDMRFVGIVLAGTTVHAHLEVGTDSARFDVRDDSADRIVVVGTAELAPEIP